MRPARGAGVVDDAFEDLSEGRELQEQDLHRVEPRALGRKEESAGRRRRSHEPRPARGERAAGLRARNPELLPGPAAEGVGERFEIERRGDGEQERRPVEGERSEEVADARAAGTRARARRPGGVGAHEGRRLLLGPGLAECACQVLEKVGGGADGDACRVHPARRVDGGRVAAAGAGLAPEEALERRREGRKPRPGEPRLVTAERERLFAARAGGNEERAPRNRVEERRETAGAFHRVRADADEAREVRRGRGQLGEARVLSLPAFLEVAVRHAERPRVRAPSGHASGSSFSAQSSTRLPSSPFTAAR